MRRRDFLKRAGVLAAGGSAGCILPDQRGPEVHHPVTPMGAMPGARGQPGYIWAGAAQVDITPPEGAPVWLAGYGFQRPMQRVQDPISARALYLDDGTRRVALVVADVVGLLHNSTLRIRRLIGAGVQTVVASTHNHQSPDTMGYWGPSILHALPVQTGMDVAYQRVLERRMAQAVARAAWSARPAQLAVTRAPVWSGAVRNLRQPQDVPKTMLVAELRARTSHETIATVVNFACHPETLGPRARLLSADFPGPLRAEVRAQRGGTCIFVNGALGGMLTPNLEDDADLPQRLAFVDTMGRRVGLAAAEAIASAPARPVDRVGYHGAPIALPSGNAMYRYIERRGLIEARSRGPGGGWRTEVGRLEVGPLQWAVMPGEPTPAVGRLMQDALRDDGAQFAGIVGLGNDELGYLLTPTQFDEAGFSYEVSVSPGREAVPLLRASLESTQTKRGSKGG